jgi:peroxiredoxin
MILSNQGTRRRSGGASGLRIGAGLLACVTAVALAQSLADELPQSSGLPVNRGLGQTFSNFTLNDAVSGRPISLFGFFGKKAAVLAFMGSDCPLARLYAPRLAELNREYRQRGVVFLGIYPNAHETEAEIAANAAEFGLDFPVLKDPGNVVADLGLVERTPEVIVLDGRAKIRYRGAIDDQYGQGVRKDRPRREYLRDALEALLAGRAVEVAATPAFGCLIDRVEPKKPDPSQAPRIRPAATELVAAYEELEPNRSVQVGKIDYASRVAAILQNKCQSCHRPGQVAPFPLLSYDDARRHGAMIREVVEERRMPPWHADPRYGRFANDRSLSAEDRAALMAWVDQGMPLGDPTQIPPPRSFPEGWTIGQPDVIFEIPESYVVPAQGVVEYVRFRVPTGFTEDRWIQAAEAQPGERSVVHHIIVYVDDHQRGREGRRPLEHLCGYAPGDMPSVYPPGTAKLVPAGSDFVFELHYTPIGKVLTDKSRVGLVFSKEPVTRRAFTVAIAEDGFIIPPHRDNVPVASSMTFDKEVRLLSFMPHMHLRGKSFRYTLTRPGGDPEVLLSVPAFDFGWQSYYILAEPILLPPGSRIDCLAHYDNSEGNPNNPDPSKTVRWGDQTFDEMMIGYVDIDMPAHESFGPSAFRRGDGGLPIRAAFQALGNLLGRRPSAPPGPPASAGSR